MGRIYVKRDERGSTIYYFSFFAERIANQGDQDPRALDNLIEFIYEEGSGEAVLDLMRAYGASAEEIAAMEEVETYFGRLYRRGYQKRERNPDMKDTDMKTARRVSKLIVGFAIVLNCVAVDAERMEVITYSARPVAASLQSITEQIGVVITYEDPKIEFEPDIVRPSPTGTVWTPRLSRLSYSYDSEQDPESIILGLLAQHRAVGNLGQFTVSRTGDVFNVYPTHAKNSNGVVVPHESPLGKRITVSLLDTTLSDAFQAVCEAASGPTPGDTLQFLAQIKSPAPYSVEFDDVLVRDALSRILDDANRIMMGDRPLRIVWRALRGPERDFFEGKYLWQAMTVPTDQPNSIMLKVADSRPMAKALTILDNSFDIRYGYEDPLLACNCDLLNDSVPSGGTISVGWNRGQSSTEIVDKLVGSYKRQSFAVTERNGRFHVYPAAVLDKDGSMHPISSLTRSEISLDAANGVDRDKALARVSAALSALPNGKSVRLKKRPPSRGTSPPVTVNLNSGPRRASDILDDLVSQQGDELSWQLIHDPATDTYELNIESQ